MTTQPHTSYAPRQPVLRERQLIDLRVDCHRLLDRLVAHSWLATQEDLTEFAWLMNVRADLQFQLDHAAQLLDLCAQVLDP